MTDLTGLQIGIVSYANALPLEYDLANHLPQASIVRDVPSRLAQQLEQNELDVALLSSIELARHPDYSFIPGLGICSDGPVKSVCLFCKKPPEEIQTVALDRSSLSSVILTRILCEYHWKIVPQYIPFSPPIRNGLHIADAAMAIGDPTLQFDGNGYQVYDLGEVWKEFCGLPFVYALWITRKGIDPAPLHEPFTQAAQSGLAKVEEISTHCAQNNSLTTELYHEYFTQCIHYHLTDRDLQGMNLFFDYYSRLSISG